MLAVQGDVAEHVRMLASIGVAASLVKTPADLANTDALIAPGGESTTAIRLLDRIGLSQPIRDRVAGGMPFWGTCMGMILAAHRVADLDQPTLGLLDIDVRRNAFGRQAASAEVELAIGVLGPEPFPAVFIRAPWIERAGPGVEVLASHAGHGVFVRAKHVLGSSFHPELTGDDRLHRYFVSLLEAGAGR